MFQKAQKPILTQIVISVGQMFWSSGSAAYLFGGVIVDKILQVVGCTLFSFLLYSIDLQFILCWWMSQFFSGIYFWRPVTIHPSRFNLGGFIPLGLDEVVSVCWIG